MTREQIMELAGSNELIAKEARHVRLVAGSRGVEWDFERNGDGTFARIFFGEDQERKVILEIQRKELSRWPVKSEATSDQITAFVLVAHAAFPSAGAVDNLARVAGSLVRQEVEHSQLLLELIHTIR